MPQWPQINKQTHRHTDPHCEPDELHAQQATSSKLQLSITLIINMARHAHELAIGLGWPAVPVGRHDKYECASFPLEAGPSRAAAHSHLRSSGAQIGRPPRPLWLCLSLLLGYEL